MKRILSIFMLVVFTSGVSFADTLFQSNNPFPSQTNSSNLNNIYEISPQVIEQEKQTQKKVKKSKWWSVNKDIRKEGELPTHQRAEDSGFVILK